MTITDKETINQYLEKVRHLGYAIDDEENLAGLSCVAAPIFDHTHKVTAAVSVAGPSNRVTKERMSNLAEAVMAAARNISAQLGCRNYRGRSI